MIILKDLFIYINDFKLKISNYLYISSVQAKTFSVTNQVIGILQKDKRFRKKAIIKNLMKLQELFISDDKLDYQKYRSSYLFYSYLTKTIHNEGFFLTQKEIKQLDIFFNDFYLSLSKDNFINEYELEKKLKKEIL